MYYGGEGSQWAAPVARDLIAAYYGVDNYEGDPILSEEELPDSVKEIRDRALEQEQQEQEELIEPEEPPIEPVDPNENNTN